MTKLYKDTNNVINLIKNDIQTVVNKYTDTVEYNLIDKCLSIKSTNGRVILERCNITTLYKEDGITTWESDLITLFSFFPNAPFITLTSFNLTDTYTDYEITGALALQTFLKTYAITTFEYQGNVINYSALLTLDTTNFKYGYIYSVDNYTIDEIPKTNIMFVWSKSGWICFGNDLIAIATNISAGLMSADDKIKLDNLDINIATDIDFQTGTDNSKRTTVIGIFNAIKYWLNNSAINTLTTVSKTIIGAINELKSTKANSGINSDITSLTGLTNPYIDTSSIQQTKLGGLGLANGFVTYGKAPSFPTGIGYYLTGYVDTTYGVRLLSYNGVSYGQLNLGARIGTTGSVFSLQMNADGTLTINGSTTSYGLHNIGNLQQDFGSDATGDMIYRLASGLLGRLPVGTTDQIISVVNGLPTYDSRIATTSKIGFVKPDNTTTSVDINGILSVPTINTSFNNSVYVSSKQTGIGTGSIGNPFATIQEAIIYMIGTGTRSNPQHKGTIVIDSGTYVITQLDNLAINGVNYNLQYNDTIINYTGNCLDSNSVQISPVNYNTTYIPQFRVKQTITSSQTTLATFITNDSQVSSCKYCTLVKLNSGSGQWYILMSDNYLVSTEYRPISGLISNTGYKALFDYSGFSNYTKANIFGLGTINLNGTAGFKIIDGLPYADFSNIDVIISTKTSLMPLFYNTTSTYLYYNFNGSFTNANGTGIWFDNTSSSNVGIKSKLTTFYTVGSSSCTYRGFNGLDFQNLYLGSLSGIWDLRNTNYLFGIAHLGTSINSGLFLSGTLSGDNTNTKQSIGLLKTYSYVTNNNNCGFYISNLTRNRQLTSSGEDCVFVPSYSSLVQDIISFYSNPYSFVIINSQLGRKLSTQTLSYLGLDKNTSVPSVNNFSTDLIFNRIPTASLPNNSYVIVVDSNGVSQKVLTTEIKTPTVVVTDTKYTTQTTIANYISNDSQASSTVKSNLVSLADGSLYVLTDSTPLIESAYKQITTIVSWSSVTNKPSFATVATSADYNDLIDKPDLTKYALVSDQNGGATIVLTADTDILALIRTYLTNLAITDTSVLIQRTISIVANGYTMTFDTNAFTTDVNFRLSCRLVSSSVGAIGDMQILNSSGIVSNTYAVSILQSSYILDRLAKYSEISPITECYNNITSTSCSTSEVSIPLVGNIYRNWTTSTIIPNSGYLTINGSITWQYSGGTGALVTFNLYVNSVKITLATDIGGSTTGKDKTTNLNGYCQVTAGDTITLKGVTSNNSIITQASSHILFKIT